ncbi:MAG: LytTR family transcriptional regulator DNA-binding domain-containing protein, partial [Angelakisella sp.]
LYFHLTDGSVREAISSLNEFENTLLARPEFIRTHRSYIVNLLQIAELTASEAITMTGNRVPISRQNYAKVRDAYVEQLFAKRG